MNRSPKDVGFSNAFTLVEILLVIAIIGIMSAIILTTVGNATQDSRLVVARQQQAALQQALNAWIAGQISSNTVSVVRSNYTAASDKLALVGPYLGASTLQHFQENTTNAAQIRSDALIRTGRYLQFSSWTTTNFPTVNLMP